MLRLELLGAFRARSPSGELTGLGTQPRRAALLAYLAVERDVSRDRVAALLWPDADPDRASHALSQAIYHLRRIIGADWVELRGDRLVVAPTVTTDVSDLERAAEAGDHRHVIELYRGSFLAGGFLGETADFEMWIDGRR